MKIGQKITSLGGDALILIAMFFFGSYSLFIRLYPLPVLSYLFAFQVVGALSFFAWALLKKQTVRADKSIIPYLIGLAVAATLNDLTYFYAFQITSVAKAAISHQMVSVFLLILAPLVLGERTLRREWVAVIIALFGIVLLFSDKGGNGANDFLGIGLGLVSGFFYAWIIILYRRLQKRDHLSLMTINTWRYCLSAVFLLPFLPVMASHDYSSSDFVVLAAFGILFAVIASAIHNLGMGLTKALHSSILGKSEPVFAVIFAYLFLSETPTVPVIAGGIIVIANSLWLTLQKEAA